MAITDDIGRRGESIAYIRLTEAFEGERRFFTPHYLGEKCPTFDYFVELNDAGVITPFFFVQVRATRRGYSKSAPSRLNVKVPKEIIEKMANYPAPTYIIGVDEATEKAYLVGVEDQSRQAMPSLSTRFAVNRDTLRQLWIEVRDYWRTQGQPRKQSQFAQ